MSAWEMSASRRKIWSDKLFYCFSSIALTATLIVFAILLLIVLKDGLARVSWDFLTGYPSRFPEQAGILPALFGTGVLSILTLLIAFPLGVGAAVYLEEYAWQRLGDSRLLDIVELNIANLAALPSIIIGLFGLAIFVRVFALGQSQLAGALTLSLLVFPRIVISSREALRAVPISIREASLALGASRWQTIYHHVLPAALPGILTGTISAVSRAIGEAAPLILVGALAYAAFVPGSLLDPISALPVQVFGWVSRPQSGFHQNAAATILVLLSILLVLNSLAIWLRNRYERR
jgi:phosphate transport system permease protein